MNNRTIGIHTQAITDPVEQIVAAALHNAGIPFERRYNGLDFTLMDGTQIECKAFHADRVTKQLAAHSSVILIQGKKAAEAFARLIGGSFGR